MITSIFLRALCGYIWVNILTLSPRGARWNEIAFFLTLLIHTMQGTPASFIIYLLPNSVLLFVGRVQFRYGQVWGPEHNGNRFSPEVDESFAEDEFITGVQMDKKNNWGSEVNTKSSVLCCVVNEQHFKIGLICSERTVTRSCLWIEFYKPNDVEHFPRCDDSRHSTLQPHKQAWALWLSSQKQLRSVLLKGFVH